MALIACEECGKEISNRASACPHCGCPVSFGGVTAQAPTLSEPAGGPKARQDEPLSSAERSALAPAVETPPISMSQFVADWANETYKHRSTGKNVAKSILVSGALSVLTAPLGISMFRTYRSLKPKELQAKALIALYPKELAQYHAAMLVLFDGLPAEMKMRVLVMAVGRPKEFVKAMLAVDAVTKPT
jgi:hypothetical protein